MKRAREIPVQDRSLNRLLQDGIPELRKGNLKMQSTAHTDDTNHEPAAVIMEEEEISFPDKVYTVHDENDQSHLLKKLRNTEAFDYQTESEVQYLSQLSLEDTLDLLGLTDYLAVKAEISVFAYRPDIIVVYHSMRGIILVVEVKKPGEDVFTSHDVGGQVYDYLVGLLGTGIRPFGVLTSYEETCIAYLDDGGVSRDMVKKVANQLDSEIPAAAIIGHAESTTNGSSPPPKVRSVLNGNQDSPRGAASFDDTAVNENGDDEDSDDDSTYRREVIYTQTFSGTNAIKGLILAVRCAIESLNTSEEKVVPFNGCGASGACALVNETGLFWTDLPSSIKFDYYNFPPALSKLYYLWKDLGRGSKGRVFLACNSKGKVCAAKFFLLDQSLLHRQEDSLESRRQERERQMAVRKKAADLECSRWADAYSGKFKKEVRVVKLNNLWCLLMPYFDPVFDRESALPAIKDILLDFKKTKNLRYADGDLRWRHVGMRDGKVFLFDLGSLEPEHPRKTSIDDQIEHLKNENELIKYDTLYHNHGIHQSGPRFF